MQNIRGAEIFSLFQKPPNANKLKLVFEKYHGSNINEITILIHPSYLSVTSLNLLFQNGNTWSSASKSFFQNLTRLKKMFIYFAVCDMVQLLTTETQYDKTQMMLNYINKNPNVIKKEENTDDYDYDILKLNFSWTIYNSIVSSRAIQRLENLANQFDQALRLYLAFGCVPMLNQRMNKKYHSKRITNLTDAMDSYLNLLEHGMSEFKVVSHDELKENVILTYKSGRFSCTDMLGSKQYTIFEFEKYSEILYSNQYFNPLIVPIMRNELRKVFVDKEASNYLLSKIVKPTLLVSTDISKFALNLLTPTSFDYDEAKKKQQQNENRVEDVMKQIINHSRASDALGVAATDIFDEYQEKLNEFEHRWSNRKPQYNILASGVKKHFGQKIPLQSMFADNEPVNYYIKPPCAHNTTAPYGISFDGNTDQINSNNRDVAEKKLVEAYNDAKKDIKILTAENKQVRNELLGYVNECQMKIKNETILKLEIEDLKQKIQNMNDQMKLKDSISKQLQVRLDETIQVMDKVGTALRISESSKLEVENRLKEMNSPRPDTSHNYVTLPTSEILKDKTQNHTDCILSLLGSFCQQAMSIKKEQSEIYAKTRPAFNQMFSNLNIRPLPCFDNPRNIHTSNTWISFPDFFDTSINDVLSSNLTSTLTNSEGADINSVVSETQTFVCIDINPPTQELISHIKTEIKNRTNKDFIANELLTRRILAHKLKGVTEFDIDSMIYKPLSEQWDCLTSEFLHLSEPSISSTGQQLPPRPTENTVNSLIVPYHAIFNGNHKQHTYSNTQYTLQINEHCGPQKYIHDIQKHDNIRIYDNCWLYMCTLILDKSIHEIQLITNSKRKENYPTNRDL
uniref:ORF3 n=1 Tax=Malaco herpesvirus 2 TaxID=3031798 RepID=A0AA48P7I1_9VIRU|nr:TPA_asm: ORF3 [Malaco herpesvirus 2]